MPFNNPDRGQFLRQATPLLNTPNVFTKPQTVTPQALTSSSGAIAVDASLSNTFTHTLTENTTASAPSNLVAGTTYTFAFTQNASAAKTLAFNAAFDFGSAGAPTISATLGKKLLVIGFYDGAVLLCVSMHDT